MLANARDGRRISRVVSLVEPMDQTKDYDRAISMLRMSVDDVLEISEEEFQMYVLDEWHWKGQFSASTVGYVGL